MAGEPPVELADCEAALVTQEGLSARAWAIARLGRQRLTAALASPAGLLSEDDRREIEGGIHAAGHLTSSYGFMLFAACGIAALGLLQSSVAVVIGAMLISPLMGPIVSMGMALARVEPREFKSAAITLAIGVFVSLLASTLIVWASPLKDVTPEILARTRPTLMDLAVALLSGFVGAYLSINGKAGSIAGVAIATALMPPLAVVGYGLATGAWTIAAGASLLFLTNVVAILAAVFGVARRYGFRPIARRGAAWEVPALFAATALLCVPLAFSLRNIVEEARETTRVRGAIERAFIGATPHITDLSVVTDRGRATGVQCVVVTRKYVPAAAAEVAKALNPGAKVSVEQVVTASGVPRPEVAANALGGRVSSTVAVNTPERRLQMMLGAAGEVVAIDKRNAEVVVSYRLNGTPSLGDYRSAEQAARIFVPETRVKIIPPLMPLPEIRFARGSRTVDAAGRETLADVAWALQRWSSPSIQVQGRASPGRQGPRPVDTRMALARATAVATLLGEMGVTQIAVATQVPDRVVGPEDAYWSAKLTLARPTQPAAGAAQP